MVVVVEVVELSQLPLSFMAKGWMAAYPVVIAICTRWAHICTCMLSTLHSPGNCERCDSIAMAGWATVRKDHAREYITEVFIQWCGGSTAEHSPKAHNKYYYCPTTDTERRGCIFATCWNELQVMWTEMDVPIGANLEIRAN